MKTTNRIHRNGGTKPATVQTKTAARAGMADAQNNPDIIDSLDEGRSAKAQSAALHWLLADVLFTKDCSVYGEQIQFGITQLIIETHQRMDRAFAALEILAESKREVAS